ncbi:c-type cytochrome [Klebsiella pneumoniae]|nr:c-type cytochrome [Klebsiella pneumoniae]
MHKHAIEGFNTMPAKGGRGELSDDDVKAAVDYMVNQSGGKF